MSICKALLVGLIGVGMAGTAQASLLMNGDFSAAPGYYRNSAPNTSAAAAAIEANWLISSNYTDNAGAGPTGWDVSWKHDATNLWVAYPNGNTAFQKGMYQSIAIPAAGDYILSYDLDIAVKPEYGFSTYVGLYTTQNLSGASMSSSRRIATVDEVVNPGGPGAWQHKTITLTLTPDQVAANQYLVVGWSGNGTIASSAIIDNVDFSPVPEPASLSLLGLGALAMLRRRR